MKIELSHEDLSQFLPWYANGTLSLEEYALVEEHLKTCGACQDALQLLRNVGVAMTELAEEAPMVKLSFDKIGAAAENSETSKRAARRRSFADWLDAIWNPPPQITRLVFVIQLALILGLGIYSYTLRRETPTYTTLSGTEESTGGARLTINFATNTTVEQMSQILSSIGGRIVSGPSPLGMYVIELPVKPEKGTEIQSVVDKLRTNGAIRFVERQP